MESIYNSLLLDLANTKIKNYLLIIVIKQIKITQALFHFS
jgi:hypothetical protein